MIYTGFGYFDIGGYRVAGGDSDSSSGPTWPMPKLSFLKGADFSKFKLGRNDPTDRVIWAL